MNAVVCARCGRTGVRGFTALADTEWVCTATQACEQRVTSPRRACIIVGCTNQVHSSGLCPTHLRRVDRTGNLTVVAPKHDCDVPGCVNPHRAQGFCEKHYRRYLKYGNPEGGPGRGKGPRPNRKPKGRSA